MTVSRIMNGRGQASAETHGAVHNAIRRLGYIPDPAARSLARAHVDRLAVLYSDPRAGSLSGLLVGVAEESSRLGAQVVIQRLEAGTTDVRPTLRKLVGSGIAGAILLPPLSDSAMAAEVLHAAGLPAVVIAPGQARGQTMCVSIDEFRAAYDMAQHLLALGHRRIGFIRGHPGRSTSQERWRGFVAALSDRGIDTSEVRVEEGFSTYRSGLDAGRRLLNTTPAPTAIFAGNDEMAAAVVAVANCRGLHVPRELSVVGFDDSMVACATWPELTTIRQPVEQMAAEGVRMLVQAIRSGRCASRPDGRKKWIGHTLIVRASTSSPPGEA